MPLKRDISPRNLLFISISGIVGSGWLFSPFYAAQTAGPAALISWVIGFVMIFIIALPFAEMASKFPVAGGIVHFSRITHGMPISFLVSWSNWLAFVAVAPIEVQATLQYSSHFFPGLIHIANDGAKALTHLGLLWALVLMLIFTFVNLIGVKFAARINSVIAIWKIIVPIILLIALFSFQFNWSNLFIKQFMPMGWHGVLAAVSTGGIVFSFIGFRAAVELGAEADNPSRAIPRALLGSLVFCVVLYVLLQFAFVGALLPEDFTSGWMHLNFHGEGGPLLDVVTTIGILWLIGLIYIDSMVSPMGAGMISNTSTSRVVYAMSQNGYLPAWFEKTNKFQVPAHALWLNFIVGMLFFLPFHGWQRMISIMVDASLVAYTVGAVAVISIRKQRLTSSREKPFLMPGGFFTGWLAFYFGTLVLYWSGFDTIWHLMIGLLVGLIALFFIHRQQTEDTKGEWLALIWFIFYLVILFVFSALGSFGGGKGWLPVGWDFLVLGIWTFIMYQFALVSRLDQPYIKQLEKLVR
ncbi:MAG: APC family permease [Coxiellaceae bacterium]|nr:APC family permease [Coxiellaceae bacterium]